MDIEFGARDFSDISPICSWGEGKDGQDKGEGEEAQSKEDRVLSKGATALLQSDATYGATLDVIHGQQSKQERWVLDQETSKSGSLPTISEKGQNISIDSNIDESEGVTSPPANNTKGRLKAGNQLRNPTDNSLQTVTPLQCTQHGILTVGVSIYNHLH